MKHYYSIEEVARELGYSDHTVRKWMRSGQIAFEIVASALVTEKIGNVNRRITAVSSHELERLKAEGWMKCTSNS